MAQKQIRGSLGKQEVREEYITRDTRGLITRFVDWLKVPVNMTTFMFTFACIAYLVPGIADICLVITGLLAWFGLSRPEIAPLKLPAQSNLPDAHERSPKDGSAQAAGGIFFLGNELRTGKEVWLTNSDCRQHFLVLGTTGAGKTETLLGFAANAISWGSGFLFCDGKGDVALFAKVYAMLRRFNREDDLLVLNYMTGNQDIGASYGEKRSNTLNPFSTGSSDGLTQMVVGLMDDTGGDGAMWKGRATAMFTGVMRALTWLRDQGLIDLNVSEIRDHLQLKRIIDLSNQETYEMMPPHIRKSIKSYLTSLPGFKESQGYNQAQTTLDQHGYLEMQFTKILGSLADVYGHIFHTAHAEVDMADVVLNRRVLVIMLPALEKSKDEIANLGKIVVATLKGMMGGTLGNKVEGSWANVVENRPTNSPSPFIVILDEVGYYMVDGMDLMAAQARSLGFSMVFAGQDINAMKRLNEKVFGSVQGNTNTKIIMRTEDPDTAKIAIEAAGKALRAQLRSYEGQSSDFASKTYAAANDANLEAIDRVNPVDLKAQDEGEMHIIHKEWLVRAKSFYVNPESSLNKRNLHLRPNHFITVSKPNREMLESQQKLPEIVERILGDDFQQRMKAAEEEALKNMEGSGEIEVIAKTLERLSKSKTRMPNPIEAACVAFAGLIEANASTSENHNDEIRSATRPGAPPKSFNPFEAGDRGFDPMLADRGMDDFGGRRDQMGRDPDFMPRHMGDRDGFAGGEDLFDARRLENYRRMPEEFDDEDEDDDMGPREVMHSQQRPFKSHKVRQNVPHGVQVDDRGVHSMAHRIANNQAVMSALAKLDIDEDTTSTEQINEAIEEAMELANRDDDRSWGPATRAGIDGVARNVSMAMPEFGDEEDEDEEEGSRAPAAPPSLTTELLGLLIDEDDEGQN
jgi:intracellular multiplication protein IcmO